MINLTKAANAFIVLILTLVTISSALATDSIALTSAWASNNGIYTTVDQGAQPELIVFVTSNDDFWLWIEVLQGSSVVSSVINGMVVPANIDSPFFQRFNINTAGLSGNYRVRVLVLNAEGSAEQFLNLRVNPEPIWENSPPVFDTPSSREVYYIEGYEGRPLEFTLHATDADGDTVSYSPGSESQLPPGAVVDSQTGLFSWIPDYDQSGMYNIFFLASDGQSSDEIQVIIMVRNTNRNPILEPLADRSVPEGQPLEFTVTATDPDNDSITYSVQNLPAGAVFDVETGQFSWTPGAGQVGSYDLTFTATDHFGGQDSETVTIVVTQVPPPAQCSDSVDNDGDGLVDLGDPGCADAADDDERNVIVPPAQCADVVDNDGDGLVDLADPGCADAADDDERNVIMPPAQCADGVDNDGDGLVDLADPGCADAADDDERNIVPPRNNAPTLIVTGDTTIDEGETLRLRATAADADNDPLTIKFRETLPGRNPSMRLVAVNTAEFTWASEFDQAGVYTVTFTVTDGQESTTQTVTVTVNDVDQAPSLFILSEEHIVMREQEVVTFDLVIKDLDQDDTQPELQYEIVGISPAKANAAVRVLTAEDNDLFSFFRGTNVEAGTARVILAPDYDFVIHPETSEEFSLVFRATEESAASSEQTITVTVNDVNRNPVLAPIGDKRVGVNQQLQFTLAAADADNDALTYTATGLPAGASFDPVSRTFSWTPQASQVGNYTVRFTVTDGFDGRDSETVTVMVTLIPPPAQCADGVDNDGDGLTDLADTGCSDANDNDESDLPPVAQCADGVDNDGDGLTDLADTDCTDAADDNESPIVANNAPTLVITGDSQINEGETLHLIVTAADADNDPLVIIFDETLPNLAPTLQIKGVNSWEFTWTSGFADAGAYAVTFTVTDGIAAPVSQTVTVTVGEVNGAPVITSTPVDLTREGLEYQYQVRATDPDNDPLTYRLLEAPSGMTIDAAGLIHWTPARTQQVPVKILVSDGRYNAYQYYTLVVREMKEDLKIVRAWVTPEVTYANGYVVVNAAVRNDGTQDLEDLRVEISFPEWGIGRISASFDLDQGSQWGREMDFQVPELVEPGEYLVQITAGNDQVREVAYRLAYVE